MALTARGWAIVLVVSCAGCEEPLTPLFPPTALVYESDSLRIHAFAGLDPCAGTGPSMERALHAFAEECGLPELDDPIELYWLPEEQVRDVCRTEMDIGGCFFSSGEAVTKDLPEEHELIHAYLQRLGRGTYRYSFFDEGLALVYGSDSKQAAPSTDLQDAISYSRDLPLHHYARAGHFVAFLIDEFGPERTVAFVLDTYEVTPDSLPSAFERHFGASLSSTVFSYESEAISCSSAGWQRPASCEDVEPTPWLSEFSWTAEVGSGCEARVAIGSSDGPVLERFGLEVDDPGIFDLRSEQASDAIRPTVELLRCGGCEDEFSFVHDLGDGGLFGLPLEPGFYIVTATFEDPEDVEASAIELRRRE